MPAIVTAKFPQNTGSPFDVKRPSATRCAGVSTLVNDDETLLVEAGRSRQRICGRYDSEMENAKLPTATRVAPCRAPGGKLSGGMKH
jgi:hypothetical protein